MTNFLTVEMRSEAIIYSTRFVDMSRNGSAGYTLSYPRDPRYPEGPKVQTSYIEYREAMDCVEYEVARIAVAKLIADRNLIPIFRSIAQYRDFWHTALNADALLNWGLSHDSQ